MPSVCQDHHKIASGVGLSIDWSLFILRDMLHPRLTEAYFLDLLARDAVTGYVNLVPVILQQIINSWRHHVLPVQLFSRLARPLSSSQSVVRQADRIAATPAVSG